MIQEDTRVFAGIDEAGLGPLLGPLTIGWSAFRVPRDRVDLWSKLKQIVSNDPREDRDRLIVADSKKVYSRNPRGRRRLEATALAFLAQLDKGGLPSGQGLLQLSPPGRNLGAEVYAAHPWYGDLPEVLPRHVPADRLELRVQQLRRVMEQAKVELPGAGVCVIPVGELNQSFVDTDNKALTQWLVVSDIIKHLWEEHAADGLSLFVDRLGGRRRYRSLVGGVFPRASVEVVREVSGLSEYVVREGKSRMRIAFAERCEERSFSVALASCLAKYARELSMEAFNDFFEGLQPNLRPTAGYTADGRRWLEEARPALEQACVPTERLVRDR